MIFEEEYEEKKRKEYEENSKLLLKNAKNTELRKYCEEHELLELTDHEADLLMFSYTTTNDAKEKNELLHRIDSALTNLKTNKFIVVLNNLVVAGVNNAPVLSADDLVRRVVDNIGCFASMYKTKKFGDKSCLYLFKYRPDTVFCEVSKKKDSDKYHYYFYDSVSKDEELSKKLECYLDELLVLTSSLYDDHNLLVGFAENKFYLYSLFKYDLRGDWDVLQAELRSKK